MKQTIRRVLLTAVLALLLCLSVSAAEAERYAVSSEEELCAYLSDALQRRVEHIVFTDGGDFEKLTEYEDKGRALELIHRFSAGLLPDEADDVSYSLLNIEQMQAGDLAGELYFYFEYWTSAEEEAELDCRAAEICAALELDGLTEEQKVQRIYEYVGMNFVYDDAHEVFSAYEGLQTGHMTCQGYTLLMHKLLRHENIGCRIITGTAGGERHGWNLVRLGHKWYNIDVTWDAAAEHGEAMTWEWFLKNDAEFPNHERDGAYDTAKFHRAHPMAAASCRADRVELKLSGRTFTSLLIRLGQRAELQVEAEGAVKIVSTDPTVVRVEQGHVLVPLRRGSCSIIGRSDAAGEIPSMWTVSVADLTGASAWAQAAVQAYYLDSLLPIALCGELTQPLTRAEAAVLLTPLAARRCPVPLQTGQSLPFDDVTGEERAAIYYLWQLGIFAGTDEDLFHPQRLLTREEAAKLLAKLVQAAIGKPMGFDAAPVCADAESISPWAQRYAAFALKAGLMQGFEDGTFRPHEPITREQMICMLQRLRSLLIKE